MLRKIIYGLQKIERNTLIFLVLSNGKFKWTDEQIFKDIEIPQVWTVSVCDYKDIFKTI